MCTCDCIITWYTYVIPETIRFGRQFILEDLNTNRNFDQLDRSSVWLLLRIGSWLPDCRSGWWSKSGSSCVVIPRLLVLLVLGFEPDPVLNKSPGLWAADDDGLRSGGPSKWAGLINADGEAAAEKRSSRRANGSAGIPVNSWTICRKFAMSVARTVVGALLEARLRFLGFLGAAEPDPGPGFSTAGCADDDGSRKWPFSCRAPTRIGDDDEVGLGTKSARPVAKPGSDPPNSNPERLGPGPIKSCC